MLRYKWIVACAVLGALSSAALAFQESKGGGGDAGPPATVAPKDGARALDLRDTGVSVAEPSGVEVRIPGLGRLGVLPKFDFGLELLYGVNDPKANQGERQNPLAPQDDVQIRGSLKHRF